MLSAQVASGIKVVRAWSRLLQGTREPGASMLAVPSSSAVSYERKNSKRRKPQGGEYRSEAQGRGVS